MLVAEGRRTRRDQEKARDRDSSIKDAQCTQPATEAILKNWLVWPVNVWHPNVKVKPRSLWAAEALPETGNDTVLSLFLSGCKATRNLSRVTDSFAFSGFMGKDPKGRFFPTRNPAPKEQLSCLWVTANRSCHPQSLPRHRWSFLGPGWHTVSRRCLPQFRASLRRLSELFVRFFSGSSCSETQDFNLSSLILSWGCLILDPVW